MAGALAALAILLAPGSDAAEPKLLEPERAFAFSARALDGKTIEARFTIADGYYLYREKLKFHVEPAGLSTPAALPPGIIKVDEFFGKVETYRGRVAVRLPLENAETGQKLTVTAESQGCADVGVCYPPQVQHVTLTMPAPGSRPGAPVTPEPARKSWFN